MNTLLTVIGFALMNAVGFYFGNRLGEAKGFMKGFTAGMDAAGQMKELAMQNVVKHLRPDSFPFAKPDNQGNVNDQLWHKDEM